MHTHSQYKHKEKVRRFYEKRDMPNRKNNPRIVCVKERNNLNMNYNSYERNDVTGIREK